MTVASTDDDVIRYRLLIDGEGCGDDKRIQMLMKTYDMWCNIVSSTNSEDEKENYSEKLNLLLEQCQLSIQKNNDVYLSNINDQKIYQEKLIEIENEIIKVVKDLEKCQNELKVARLIRKNNEEYDDLAKTIKQHPERKESLDKLTELQSEIETLEHENKALDENFAKLRKQFYSFLHIGHDLQLSLPSFENDANVEKMEINDENNVNIS